MRSDGKLFNYVRQVLDDLLPKCKAKPLNVLVLGLGGGTMQSFLQEYCPDSEITTVEGNSAVVSAALAYFGFKGKTIVGSASTVLGDLASRNKVFDAVVIDIDDTVLDKEAFHNISSILRDGGIVFQNHTANDALALQKSDFEEFF